MPFYSSRYRAASFQDVLHSFLQEGGRSFADLLTEEQIQQAAAAEQLSFGTGRQDVWSVPVTLWTFLAQVASEAKSCLAAVARTLALLTALGHTACSAATGAYCKARAKLTETFLRCLARNVGCQLEDEAAQDWRWRGHRAFLVDGSGLSMPDTAANQAVYPQSRSQRAGVGFPLMRWVAVVGLATGALVDAAFGPYRGKETGETALFRTLLDTLRAGDVLVADRYYCSYWMVALAQARGVHVVFRQHQLRHTDFRRGRRLGRRDHVVTWHKPVRPAWMDAATYAAVAATLQVREMRAAVGGAGCRVRELTVVTTLLDAEAYPKEDIMDLYSQRWHVEVDLRSIKTHMHMDVLRCKTPEMVRKEIWVHLLAYNLVRAVMAQAAREHGVQPRHLSFVGALQTLSEFRVLLMGADAVTLSELRGRLLAAIASHRVGDRPNRCEPRKVKRRPKGYSRLMRPRGLERAELRRQGRGR